MNNAKWLSMLGLARRAGKLAMGHDLALQSVRDGKAQLVLTARNVSPRLVREFETAGQKRAKAPRMRALPCTMRYTLPWVIGQGFLRWRTQALQHALKNYCNRRKRNGHKSKGIRCGCRFRRTE